MIEKAKKSILPICYLNSRTVNCHHPIDADTLIAIIYEANFRDTSISFSHLICFIRRNELREINKKTYLINKIQYLAYDHIVNPKKTNIHERYQKLNELESTLIGQEIVENSEFQYLSESEMRAIFPLLYND